MSARSFEEPNGIAVELLKLNGGEVIERRVVRSVINHYTERLAENGLGRLEGLQL